MINRKTSLYIIIFLPFFLACQNDLSKEEISGVWELYYSPISQPKFYQFQIVDDSIIYTDEYYIPYKTGFQLSKNKLTFKDFIKDRHHVKFLSIINDTLLTEDSLYYVRNYNRKEIHYYSLPKVKSKLVLDKKSNFPFLHYYSCDGKPKVKLGDGSYTLNDLFHFSERISRDEPFVIIVGRKIRLVEFKRLYAYLSYLGWRKTKILTNINKEYEYEIIEDNIEIWKDESQEILGANVPPPLPPTDEFPTRLSYNKINPENIIINTVEDIQKIETLKNNSNYLISINKDLKISEYLDLKIILNKFTSEAKSVILICEII
jgi:hypothetical protein